MILKKPFSEGTALKLSYRLQWNIDIIFREKCIVHNFVENH